MFLVLKKCLEAHSNSSMASYESVPDESIGALQGEFWMT